jgi:hypothetical protein
MDMHRATKWVAAALALAAGAFVMFPRARAQDGQPSLAGQWKGRLTVRTKPLTNEGIPQRFLNQSHPCDVTVTQDGGAISMHFVIHWSRPEPLDLEYDLAGYCGSRHFWVSDGDAEGPFVLGGIVRGDGDGMVLRASGLDIGGPAGFGEIALVLTRQPASE